MPGRPQAGSYAERLPRLVKVRLGRGALASLHTLRLCGESLYSLKAVPIFRTFKSLFSCVPRLIEKLQVTWRSPGLRLLGNTQLLLHPQVAERPDDALTSPESPNRLEVQVPLGARSWLYFLSIFLSMAGHRAALRQQDLHQRPLDCEPSCLSTQAKNKISRPHPFVCGPSRCPKLNVSTGTAGSASA
jgi:hypothetical protein